MLTPETGGCEWSRSPPTKKEHLLKCSLLKLKGLRWPIYIHIYIYMCIYMYFSLSNMSCNVVFSSVLFSCCAFLVLHSLSSLCFNGCTGPTWWKLPFDAHSQSDMRAKSRISWFFFPPTCQWSLKLFVPFCQNEPPPSCYVFLLALLALLYVVFSQHPRSLIRLE